VVLWLESERPQSALNRNLLQVVWEISFVACYSKRTLPKAKRSSAILIAFPLIGGTLVATLIIVGLLCLGFNTSLRADDPPASATESTSTAATQRPVLYTQVERDKVICFVLYTVHERTLNLTAQLYPLQPDESRTVRLELEKNGRWQQVAESRAIEPGWTVPFRVQDWDPTRSIRYRVLHGPRASFEGTIRKDPVHKDEIVVAAFTGNSIYPDGGGDISRIDLVNNVKQIDPDLLFFSGDQVYDHKNHLGYWLKFGRDFGDVIRDRPTITIPDDHDVGQGNLWGAGGKQAYEEDGHDGGYVMPVEYVNEVQRAQTSHLPAPYDPTPVARGITVYYTDLNLGGIGFAILEDRKFKSGLKGVVPQLGPRPDHVRAKEFDPSIFDVPEARLLGKRQLEFLQQWSADWTDVEMKAVLSQTIFCGGAHIHGGVGRLDADLDSNGWPQSGRNRALREMRKGFAVHIAGDQHLGTIFHHGIDHWGDAGYSFCVPSIANFYLRWWDPEQPGANRQPGMPDYTGQFQDGLGNRITCYAAANPSMKHPQQGKALNVFAAGFGVVRFNKKSRKIAFECWPRNVDVSNPAAKQYPGWPLTIDQLDNYGRAAKAWLPTLKITGAIDPVVQVINQADGEVIYTLRIKGTSFRPHVFAPGRYTVHVGEGASRRTIKDLEAGEQKTDSVLEIVL